MRYVLSYAEEDPPSGSASMLGDVRVHSSRLRKKRLLTTRILTSPSSFPLDLPRPSSVIESTHIRLSD